MMLRKTTAVTKPNRCFRILPLDKDLVTYDDDSSAGAGGSAAGLSLLLVFIYWYMVGLPSIASKRPNSRQALPPAIASCDG